MAVLGTAGRGRNHLRDPYLKLFVNKEYSSDYFSLNLLFLKVVPSIFLLSPHIKKKHRVYLHAFMWFIFYFFLGVGLGGVPHDPSKTDTDSQVFRHLRHK